MGNGDQESPNKTVREWIKALGTLAAAIGIFTGVLTFYFKKEKEASDRLLHIIALLDSKNCQTVRAGASTTMGVYLDDYKQFQKRAYWVMANTLATEEDSLVRHNILNILKGAEAIAIEPLACMNRFLVAEEMHRLSFILFSIDLAFRSGLDDGNISKELRQEFEKNYVRLSENASVLIAEKGSRWLISNKDNGQKYTVRKEEDQLSIYRKDDELANLEGLSSETEFRHLLLNNKLRDITIALSVVLEKGRFPKEGKRYLRNTILSNFNSPAKINLDNTDFEQGDLSCARLNGVSLKQANLKQANLEKAFLWNVDLKRSELKQANLEFATLYKVDLTEAIMCGANLFSATLEDTVLKGADLTGTLLFSIDAKKYQIDLDDLDKGIISKGLRQAFEDNGILLAVKPRVDIKEKAAEYVIVDIIDDFRKRCRISKEQGNLNIYSDTILDFANLHEVDLTGALLTNASLQGATLTHANMVNATLQGADLFEADLTNANLAGADLFEADLTDANLASADLKGAILESANLTGANLKGANLKGANLNNAILSGADLKQAVLVDAALKDANLTEAILEGTDLEGADLAGADLEGADLRAALLFGIDSNKFQSDLDKRTISEGLQQEFGYNGIYPSENTIVSVEQKDRRWLITDKDNEQTYTVRKKEHLNICTVAMIVLTELFGIDSKFQSDLDKGTISEDFQKEFENNEISLSENTTISIEEKDRTWLIADKDYWQTYTVRKEDGQLKIYERTKLDPTELFSIDSKKFQSDFDKGTISEDLRQEFKNNWLDLSENTAISVKEKGRIWLINDKDNEQTYTVKKEERLNIYKRTKFDPTDIKKARNWQNAIFDDGVKQKLLSQ